MSTICVLLFYGLLTMTVWAENTEVLCIEDEGMGRLLPTTLTGRALDVVEVKETWIT